MTSLKKLSMAALAACLGCAALAQKNAQPAVPVTADNFVRAETDMYFTSIVRRGGFGKLQFTRELVGIDKQTVVRINRDTLYASGIFDLDAGPVTITLPDAGKRFMSMQVLDEDHYTPLVSYRPGSYTLTRKEVGTRYALVGVRILVDPNDAADVQRVHALQDAIQVRQKSTGSFETPNWDADSQKKVREALRVLANTLPDTNGAFGPRGKVDPVRRLTGAASAWGGNPQKDAMYLNVVPEKNDGTTVHRLVVKDVPVDGFWSISVYNAQGYYEANAQNAYTINSVTGKKNADGSVAVQFGGCEDQAPNCIPVMQGWNYMVRLYRPRGEILSGQWQFPKAQPAS
ncbi:DUF1254 domain-containing protein [Variovorax rhizosphaerae]|uniref:DUF1254 domain-containing protein n=1 Tax=Variovorax rhizosphaerae TaxID=1836200 RepID=A0ABU8WGM4_9BURK